MDELYYSKVLLKYTELKKKFVQSFTAVTMHKVYCWEWNNKYATKKAQNALKIDDQQLQS